MYSCCVTLPVPSQTGSHARNPPSPMPRIARRPVILAAALVLSGCTADARGAPDSFAPLVKKVLPTVVNIAVTETTSNRDLLRDLPPELRDTPLGREFRRRFGDRQERTLGAGSGFIIDS